MPIKIEIKTANQITVPANISGKLLAKMMNVAMVQPPAGIGRPTKKRLLKTRVVILKRAKRKTPQAA